MGLQLDWNDVRRRLTMSLAAGSQMLPSFTRSIEVTFKQTTRKIVFDGRPLNVLF